MTRMTTMPPHSRPLVSVLSPSFNQARWLADCLRSVEAQDYPFVEHIVMDGGSTDGSIDILRANVRPGVVWESESDAGQSAALNKAYSASSGEIIGWLNSDDAYFTPSVISGVVSLFLRNPDVAVVYGHAALVDADGLILQVLWAPPFSRTLLRVHDFLVQPAVFMRRSALGDGFVDPSFDYTMDYELWLRLARRHPFARMNAIVAIDRHHPERKSYLKADVGISDHKRLQQRYGVAGGLIGRLARKAVKVLSRVCGVSQIPSLLNVPLAFAGRLDSALDLLRRQVATLRAWM